jgi:hypothetical protein
MASFNYGGASSQREESALPEAAALDSAALEVSDTRTRSRGFFLELVLDLVVFIICALVCLQIIATALVQSEQSGAVSTLGLAGQSLAEQWKSGDSLDELAKAGGGSVNNDQLTLYFDRQYQPTSDASNAWYELSLTQSQPGANFEEASVSLSHGSESLFTWQLGRVQPDGGGN